MLCCDLTQIKVGPSGLALFWVYTSNATEAQDAERHHAKLLKLFLPPKPVLPSPRSDPHRLQPLQGKFRLFSQKSDSF